MDKFLDGFRPYIILSLFCFILYLPGISTIPPMDRDEARFAQASKQMLESSDYVRINFQKTPRHKKPAGIYWLQATSVKIFSDVSKAEIWAYRIPSFIGAWASVMMLMWFGSVLFRRKIAFFGAGLLACSVLMVTEAHLAKTDAFLLACVVAVQGVLAAFYMQERKEGSPLNPKTAIEAAVDEMSDKFWSERVDYILALIFWTALGIGVLIKGPILPMIVLATLIPLCIADKKAKWLMQLKPLIGLPIALIIAVPWFIAVNNATGGSFTNDAIVADLLPKLLGGQESHGAFAGYYLLLVSLTLWPASLFLFPSLYLAYKEKAIPAQRFCIAWALPTWIIFELIPTKLPHYVLPVYPALTLLIASAMFAMRGYAGGILTHWTVRIYYIAWGIVCFALGGGLIYLPYRFGQGSFEPWSATAAFGAFCTAVFSLAIIWDLKPASKFYRLFATSMHRRFAVATVVTMISGAVMFVPVFQFVMPKLDSLWLSRQTAEIIEKHSPNKEFAVASVGYHEPSLVFLLGTDTMLTNTKTAVTHIFTNSGAIAIVANKHLDEFKKAIELYPNKSKGKIKLIEEIKGFNYSRGKNLTLSFYAMEK